MVFVYIQINQLVYDTVVLKLLKEDIGDKYDWRSVFNKIDQTSEYKQVEGGSGHINDYVSL